MVENTEKKPEEKKYIFFSQKYKKWKIQLLTGSIQLCGVYSVGLIKDIRASWVVSVQAGENAQ